MSAIQLSDHFTYKKLLRFTIPSMTMMVFVSLYSIVDGLFVSNLIGDLAFSAINIAYPPVYIIGAIGHMIGAGGSAVIAKTLGENKPELAKEYFSMLVVFAFITSILFSIIGIIFIEPILVAIGVSDILMDDALKYTKVLFIGLSLFVFQASLQKILITAQRPKLGLYTTIAAGITNVIFDYVFIAIFGMGVEGAALATILGYLVGGGIPLLYFIFNKNGIIKFVKPKLHINILKESCVVGVSAMLNSLSNSLLCILFNIQLMKFIGEPGVAAYGIMIYMDFIGLGIYNGFTMGVSPIISYHYGANNPSELKNLFGKSLKIVITASIILVSFAQIFNWQIASMFVGYNKELVELTVYGFKIFSLNYLVSGFCIFSAGWFTALCDGKTANIVSTVRVFVLKGGFILLLPLIYKEDGIWMSAPASEAVAAIIFSVLLMRSIKKINDEINEKI